MPRHRQPCQFWTRGVTDAPCLALQAWDHAGIRQSAPMGEAIFEGYKRFAGVSRSHAESCSSAAQCQQHRDCQATQAYGSAEISGEGHGIMHGQRSCIWKRKFLGSCQTFLRVQISADTHKKQVKQHCLGPAAPGISSNISKSAVQIGENRAGVALKIGIPVVLLRGLG